MSAFAFVPPIARATYSDLELLRPDVRGEIVYGEMCMTPRPDNRHARAAMVLAQALAPLDRSRYSGGGGGEGWLFLFEPELRIEGDAVIPDIAGWRAERYRQISTDYPDIAPDWVCEILSPFTERRDWTSKADWYLQHGVRWYWIVDPRARSIECFEASGTLWQSVGKARASDTARLAPFAELALNVGEFWLD
jgi:Uma2 family endonuclease